MTRYSCSRCLTKLTRLCNRKLIMSGSTGGHGNADIQVATRGANCRHLVYGKPMLKDSPACLRATTTGSPTMPPAGRTRPQSLILRAVVASPTARLRFVHQYIIEELFPLGLAAAGLDFLIPVLRRVAPNHLVRLKPFVDEIVGQALRDPSWPEEAMTVLQNRIERGLWVQGGAAAPETIGSVLESVALAMELKPAMVSQFYDGLVGMLEGVLLIGRSGVCQIDYAVAEERIQAFAEAA